tara:strand:+ start:205 stop:357 length:153 start_codon:yes stop_codon:yes gene_type:complete
MIIISYECTRQVLGAGSVSISNDLESMTGPRVNRYFATSEFLHFTRNFKK